MKIDIGRRSCFLELNQYFDTGEKIGKISATLLALLLQIGSLSVSHEFCPAH